MPDPRAKRTLRHTETTSWSVPRLDDTNFKHRHRVLAAVAMDLLVVVVVVVAVSVLATSADDDSCSIRPVFNSKEQSASFFAKSPWASDEGAVYEEETLFVRRRNCPVRVRGREIEENGTKSGAFPQTLPNGSNDKDSNAKKQNNGQKKLKGSKRKRKKEKRKRFRKKKKNSQGTKTKR